MKVITKETLLKEQKKQKEELKALVLMSQKKADKGERMFQFNKWLSQQRN